MNIKTLSPITKIWFIISLLVLLLWVIPNVVSYYKNQKLYAKKVVQIEKLDKRENSFGIKNFHSEVFKSDAEEYFDKVDVISSSDNSYKVTILFAKESLPKFHTFLKNISLNYRVSVENSIVYKEMNKSMRVNIVVKPF
ncbi:hypothetical protein GSY74_06360 [Sulfurovum sp. bin170]|uniref:hypothetical protein n=1 Tax=Sulfurovum sp. bin170 TaxID=2695268 RepID=UPI0013E00543|nr:hypothetical protein [Sulfurovum sp. bin170]NEW60902.1 hypothetical protein [Sulfurovum sp. bin170]